MRRLLGALSLACLIALGVVVPTASAATLSAAKVVIIVGPVAGSTGGYETDANEAADILIALRANHIDIENAAIEQPSLDEVFMALTGNAGVNPATTTEMSAA